MELKDNIHHVSLPKNIFCSKKILFSDKLVPFFYSAMIRFYKTDKVKGILLFKNFIENLKGMMNNKTYLHHSHIGGEIIGYAHSFCNAKVRENKYRIPVVVHNFFRFDFFFFIEGFKGWRLENKR